MRLTNPIPFRLRLERQGPSPRSGRPMVGRRRTVVSLIGVAALAPLLWMVVPAQAATTGSNAGTVTLTPAAVRSVTVTPATSVFANCTGGNASELAFPNGACQVGTTATTAGQPVSGGVTITNGAAAGHIDVSGGNAVPTDAGTPWSLTSANPPGANQFFEETEDYGVNSPIYNGLTTTPACDTTFNLPTSGCTAAANQSTSEELVIVGPTTSSDSGPFTITTTWTAVP